MGRRREYISNLTMSRDTLYRVRRAQYEIRMQGFTNVSEGKLITALGAYSTVLSLAFMLPTPVTLAAGVISAISGAGNERATIIAVCKNGEDYLQELLYFLDDHPQYDSIRADLPFLEFIDEKFRIVHGKGVLTAVHAKNGWISQ
ncbi:hypothetical protein FITA111629_15235 [Filibacter tadaridae]|uniref:Uncharacterized protein n=1 Tax=Filibacter tadaridae TaxID=2483811 RepID=A0A3P5WSY0_9BACL|nr:hypothetical protein [Filibacter tadaridae]VDC18079.1 hypothetical protein FILTAD_00019 [Filibacter tadaridae]